VQDLAWKNAATRNKRGGERPEAEAKLTEEEGERSNLVRPKLCRSPKKGGTKNGRTGMRGATVWKHEGGGEVTKKKRVSVNGEKI